ncbi:anhydro-N-acetylmuramic acid kinase [Rhizobium sp. RU20A]|uniref:anhydro-N-acetylmuramic acid kinase n=1 Tax=Rhizobium sp. RU20A TaxID=1907412 RepID=UPI00122CEF87|nr:anhydro-N-acetylmuramic acid kinase [Rhizobium sp. RU20A]
MTDGRFTALGLMSGTSMDGIDAALIVTDGEGHVERLGFHETPYTDGFRRRLEAGLKDALSIRERSQRPGDLPALERDLTLLHAVAVRDSLSAFGLSPGNVDVVGFHGQTVLHRPLEQLTVQIGDGALLAHETGIATVYDMRAADIAAGGQGAPLIPAYHAALAATLAQDVPRPVAFLNIGGISNLTFIGTDGALVAFDSGPGNMLIDQWMALHERPPIDRDGQMAAAGKVDAKLAARYLGHPFFTSNRLLSLDRGDFRPPARGEIGVEDGARTLAYVTAAAVLASARRLPQTPKSWIVSGGGARNPVIMAELAALATEATVMTATSAGFDGAAMEAEAWAYLAVRSMKGLALTYPGTTGVAAPMTGGVLARPAERF